MSVLDQPCIQSRDAFSDRKGDWMQTYTGRQFWPLDPRSEDVCVEDVAHALSLLTRYGGHCLRFYSVAEHCVLLARAAPPNLALWLLLHDASEAYLSDMVRPLKRQMPEYRRAEDAVTWAAYEAFGLDPGAEPAEVRLYDNRILMDERAQVMRPTGDAWNYGGATEPLGVTLQFWPPERAECEFLVEFARLTNPAAPPPPQPTAQGGDGADLEALSRAAAMDACAEVCGCCSCRQWGWQDIGQASLCRTRYLAARAGLRLARAATLPSAPTPGLDREAVALVRHALTQASGALRLNAMVDEDGKPYGTTVVALEAIAEAKEALDRQIPAPRDGSDGEARP